MNQEHLNYKDMTDYGCFYTPEKFVDNLVQKVKESIINLDKYTIMDTSCGYGAFLSKLSEYKTIGCDIDNKAIEIAKKFCNTTKWLTFNTLSNFDRKILQLTNEDKIVIIGNPPYNDTTSKVKQEIKENKPCEVDADLKTRDLGISFLLSYDKLKADYVAVLHPLSYMIKKANYKLLKPFFNNYQLIEHTIINSQDFYLTSKSNGFPIIIALYIRDASGTTYDSIMDMTYQTFEGKEFNLKRDYIQNYIKKYPNKNREYKNDDIMFFTMRDINALKRSRTFIPEYSDNAIIIDKKKLRYYCYVDVFKDYAEKIPYYLGNSDVFIDIDEFKKIENAVITKSIEKHPFIREKIKYYIVDKDYGKIDDYFNNLFETII